MTIHDGSTWRHFTTQGKKGDHLDATCNYVLPFLDLLAVPPVNMLQADRCSWNER